MDAVEPAQAATFAFDEATLTLRIAAGGGAGPVVELAGLDVDDLLLRVAES